MYIDEIKIKNFRNIENCNLKVNSKINIIYGNNAQGKTNFLESIYFSNFYKSFRSKNNKDLIKKDKSNLNIDIDIKNKITKNNLKISFDKQNKKNIKINNNKPEFKNLYNIINIIFYYPAEINYLNLYPIYRRNLIDRSIFHIDNNYIYDIRKYNKILKNRNIFLKNKKVSYDPWIDQLINCSINIIKKRIDYINRINKKFNILFLNKIIEEKYFIKYKLYEIDSIKNDLYNRFKDVEYKEKLNGYTLFGPHTDNFNFFINDNNIKNYSSEGQKKFFLLSYKYSQSLDYIDYHKENPIMLFDDYSTELDNYRKNSYFNTLLNSKSQIFITTTRIPDNIPIDTTIFEVKNGCIQLLK